MKKDIQSLVPRDKFDHSTLNELEKLSDSEMSEILDDLLFWLADANWPIAEPVAKILAKRPKLIMPLLKEHLGPEEQDDGWKYFLIYLLLPMLPEEDIQELLPLVERIATAPTAREKLESREAAVDFLEKREARR